MFEVLRKASMETAKREAAGQNKPDKMITKPNILAGISHEVRTQMNSIMAFSYLINNDRFNLSEKNEFSQQIISSCEQLMGLIENFFDSVNFESVPPPDNIRETDLSKLFGGLTSDFRVLMRKRSNEDVIFIQEDNLPDKLMLMLDETRIRKIITNLFRNAADHTVSGFIKVGCTYHDETITIYVKDSGQGYTRSSDLLLSDNPDIQQSDSQDTYSAMNLILARNLILASEGKIKVEFNDAEGTSIFVILPVKECPGIEALTGTASEDKIAI